MITLAIIGVVAGMTIPALMNNIHDQEFKSAWKENFSAINRAGLRFAQDNGGSLVGSFTYNNDDIRDKFGNYLSYSKKCNIATSGCWHDITDLKALKGDNTITWPSESNFINSSSAILSNGTLIAFLTLTTNCDDNHSPQSDTCAIAFVDINGVKGPNTIGRDLYGGVIIKDGRFLPFGTQYDPWDKQNNTYSCDLKAHPYSIGWSCSAEYLK